MTSTPDNGSHQIMTDFTNGTNPGGQFDAGKLTTQAKVYAARMRLQEALDQADALEGIREISANLIGSEELAIYKVDKEKGALWLYWSFGIDPNKYAMLDVMMEPNLVAAVAGKIVLRENLHSERLLATDDPVNALVPIRQNGATSGLVVLFRLLPQKPLLDAADREICEVVSHFGARAIDPYRA